MPNLVSLTCPGLQKLDKTQTQVFPIFGFLAKSFRNKNCHNSTNTNDIDMKLKIVKKPGIRNISLKKNSDFLCKFLLANYNVIIFLIIS